MIIFAAIGVAAIIAAVLGVIAYFVDEHEKVERCEWRINRQIEDITELFKITNELREKLEKTDEKP